MLSSIPVLLNGPTLPLIEERIRAEFAAICPWLTPDPETTLAEAAGSIRAIASNASHAPIDGATMDRFPALEIIAHYGVGYDSIDARAAAGRGIVVTNTPGVLDDDVADLALGLLLSVVRDLPAADAFVRSGAWAGERFPLAHALRGRRVGIAGLGRIGKAIARRCEAFGLSIAYFGRSRQEGVDYPHFTDLTGLAAAVDVLILSMPGNAATARLVDAGVLRALGPQGVLINVARGNIVDEDALLAALADRTIAGAGLDVFVGEPRIRPEFAALRNVVMAPHIGSATVETRAAMGNLVVDNLRAHFSAGKALTPVPETAGKR